MSSAARNAILPRLLAPGQVPAANTLNFTMSSIGTVAGPLLAGLVLAGGSYAAAYAVDAVLFTVGFYAALRLPTVPPTAAIGRPGLRSVIEGLRFIGTRPVLLMSFAVDCARWSSRCRGRCSRRLRCSASAGRARSGGWSRRSRAGSVLAGLASGWVGRIHRQGLALIGAVVVWGLAVAGAGLAHNVALVIALLAVAGAADLVSGVYRMTILQVYAPDEMRGRLQGVFTVVVAGGPRLGDLRAGVTAAVTGVTFSWVGGGIACVVAVLVLAVAVPSLARYTTDSASSLLSPAGTPGTSTPSAPPSPQS